MTMDLARLRRTARRLRLALRASGHGLHPGTGRSPLRGIGSNFTGFRPYEFGDDLRQVDWNVTARTGRLVVKTFQAEYATTLALVIDGSASMRAARGDKWRTAREVGALLAFVALNDSVAVGAAVVTSTLEGEYRRGRGPQHVAALARWLAGFRPRNAGTALTPGIESAVAGLRPGSIVAIVSDFIDDGWDMAVRKAARRHVVIGIHISSAADDSWPGDGLMPVVDAENGRRCWIDLSVTGSRTRVIDGTLRRRRLCLARLRLAGAGAVDVRSGVRLAPQLRRVCAMPTT